MRFIIILFTLVMLLPVLKANALWPFSSQNEAYDFVLPAERPSDEENNKIAAYLSEHLTKKEFEMVTAYISRHLKNNSIGESVTVGEAIELQREYIDAKIEENRNKPFGKRMQEAIRNGYGIKDQPCPEALVRNNMC